MLRSVLFIYTSTEGRGLPPNPEFSDMCNSILDQLDVILSPRSLDQAPKERCQVLFLITLGILLAVQNSTPVHDTSFVYDRFASRTRTTIHDTIKEHICRMLNYHSILIASRVGLHLNWNANNTLLSITFSFANHTWETLDPLLEAWVSVTTLQRVFSHHQDQWHYIRII
jgi:aerobic-type carbon monoxide dehydrogenase small subunit (CoxS/CutS family)